MAYTFNGTSQYLNGASAPASAMPLTLACWLRQPTVSSGVFQMIFQINNNAQATTTTGTYRIFLPTNNSILRASQATNGTAANSDSAANAMSANTWAHCAGVFASTTSRTGYVNGVASTTNTTSLAAPSVATLNIGAAVINTNSASTFLAGDACEVGVWSVALTADEIASLAKGVACEYIRPQSLVFYAPLVRNLVDVARGITLTNVNTATVTDNPRVYA